MVDPRVM